MQDALTLAWINKFPLLQPRSPAALVAWLLSDVLGPRISDYVYVDFASGAGGPTPFIEKALNTELSQAGKPNVEFVLSDISPHISAWTAAAKKSENLGFVPQRVDATDAPSPKVLLQNAHNTDGKKIMRLFSLAFHHFDDDLATKVLQNTIETSDGFWYVLVIMMGNFADEYSIFELQSRTWTSLIMVSLLWPMLMLTAPFFYIQDPVYLFFTYLLPWVPFIVVFDGYISMLRTRTAEEIQTLLKSRVSADELTRWKFLSGETQHTWLIGWLNWVICYKED